MSKQADRRHERLAYDYPQPQPAENERRDSFGPRVYNRRVERDVEEATPRISTFARSYSPVRRQAETVIEPARLHQEDHDSNTDHDLYFEPPNERPEPQLLRYDSDDEAAENGLFATKVYDFNPSRLSRSPSRERSSAASGSEGEGLPAEPEGSGPNQNRDTPRLGVISTANVYRSGYVGDAYVDGSHSARLTVIHDPKKKRKPLFRWMYVCYPMVVNTKATANTTHPDISGSLASTLMNSRYEPGPLRSTLPSPFRSPGVVY